MRINFIPKWRPYECKLILEFDSIANVTSLLGDVTATNFSAWNNFFQLPKYGNPFTGAQVVTGNTCVVTLLGGYNITVRPNLFKSNIHLLKVYDYGCIVNIEIYGFAQTTSATSFVLQGLKNVVGIYAFWNCNATFECPILETTNGYPFYTNHCNEFFFPKLKTAAASAFENCTSKIFRFPLVNELNGFAFNGCKEATTFYLPSLTYIKSYGFYGISGNHIILTIPAIMMTCYNGSPDPQIQSLMKNNDVTVIQV